MEASTRVVAAGWREKGQGQVRGPASLAVITALPEANFSNCSRQGPEKALLGGMGSCSLNGCPVCLLWPEWKYVGGARRAV